jgi:hypothetical protein
MKTYDNEVYNYVDQLKNYSTTNISGMQKGIVPEVVDISWDKMNYYVSKGVRRYVTYEKEGYVIRITGVRYRLNHLTKKTIDFDKRMTDAVNEGLVYPFMLFVDGRHIKWSTFRVVRNAKYTYLVCDRNSVKDINPLHISKVEMVNLPFTYMSYSETRKIPNPNTELFRFDEDGLLSPFGSMVYSLDTSTLKLETGSFKVLAGGRVENRDLDLDAKYKLTKNNFLCWANGLFDKTIDPDIKNLNIITMNNGEPLDYELQVKYFYRDITNHNRSNITIPENKDLLKSLVIEQKSEMPELDIKALGRDFDFQYKYDTDYEDNVNSGIRYISRYNSSMFDKLYEKRLKIHSRSISGKELKDQITNNLLSLPRGYHKNPETYVIIYKNGELWNLYNRIRYKNNNFEIPITNKEISAITDYDEFEFTYFTGVNNNYLKVECTEDNNTIENTTIKYDDLMVFANYTEGQIYKELPFNKRTIYDVKYTLDKDHKTVTFTNPAYYGKTIYMAAKNQFKYQHFNITKPTIRYFFGRDFIPCLNKDRFAVFHNGRLLSKDMYRVIVPEVENTATEVCVHVRRVAQKGDTVDIFYLPYDFNYTDIGKTNRVDVVTVRATVDQQPVFAIPFPSKSSLLNKNSFLLLRGSVLVDQSRYNVIGRTVVFNDPKDYVAYGREVTFVFLYSENIESNPYGGVEEDDVLNIDPQFVIANKDNQLTFDIPYPEGFDGFFFLTYRGIYVNPKRYEIMEGTKQIKFFDQDTGIDAGTALIFVFIYPEQKNKVGTSAVSVRATIDNQLKFSIPLPYAKYFDDQNSFFLIRNGVFLNEAEYYIDTKANTVDLLTTNGLDIGQELVFNFITGRNVSVKTAIEEVRAEQDGQLVFKLPKVFHDFDNKTGKFFCVIGDTYIDNRRFEVVGNDLRFLNREDAVLEGRTVTFIFVYTEDIDAETATIGGVVNTSKYTKFITESVKCKEDGQRTFTIPWEDSMLMDKKIIVTVGSTFIRESQYTISKTLNTLTFIDDGVITTTDREVTFTLADSDYTVIAKEVIDIDAVVDGQTEFDIPLPFENYLKLGNSLMVFANQTFIDASRYVLDKDLNKITLRNYNDALNAGQTLSFLYFYIANQSNRSLEREDVQHPMINERGYLYLNRNDLEHLLNNKLYFMFINGKKINKDNIMNVANNIIRLKNDVQTRFNTLILDYTPSIPELAKYKDINSDYDIIMNQISNEDINKLFNIHNNVTDLEKYIVPDTSQEAIINDIIRTHYTSNGVNKGLPFVYTYDTSTFKNRSIYSLATTVNKYIAPGKYTFTCPDDVTMLEIKSIASASRIRPINRTIDTIGYLRDKDFEFGEVSYILPSDVSNYIDTVIGKKDLNIMSQPLYKEVVGNLPEVNDFIPAMKPLRKTESKTTLGRLSRYFYQKEIIRNVKVHPGLKYKITVPTGGFVHIAYDVADTDISQYHLKYRIDFDSDRDNTPIFYKGDTLTKPDTFVNSLEEIYSDDFNLQYNQSFTKPGEEYWICPDNVGEIILTLCSGYSKMITIEDIERYPAAFQFCGYGSTDFSIAPVPAIGNMEFIELNSFYDRVTNEYDSKILNTIEDGHEIHYSSNNTLYGCGISEIGFVERDDEDAINSSKAPENRNRINLMLINGVRTSRSDSSISREVTSYIKVEPGKTYTIRVGKNNIKTDMVLSRPETEFGGVLGISYHNKVLLTNVDTNVYLSNALDATHINNPDIDYSGLNTEMTEDQLAGDPGVSHVVSDEEAIEERDKPVFVKELPKIAVDENDTDELFQTNIFDASNVIRE